MGRFPTNLGGPLSNSNRLIGGVLVGEEAVLFGLARTAKPNKTNWGLGLWAGLKLIVTAQRVAVIESSPRHSMSVIYICLHWPLKPTQCRYIYHTWSVWDCWNGSLPVQERWLCRVAEELETLNIFEPSDAKVVAVAHGPVITAKHASHTT